jgi:hypothetical protein
MKLIDRLHDAAEQIGDLSRIVPMEALAFSGIRSFAWGQKLGLKFWVDKRPSGEDTAVNYNLCRELYRSTESNLGSGFAKPIVDLQVAFIGIPRATTENDAQTQFLNDCLQDFWMNEMQQWLRDAIRDSKTVVRLQRPSIIDPLMTIDEAEHGMLEIIPPELVDIERNALNRNIIERAVVHHKLTFVLDDGNIAEGRDPTTEEHEVDEIITRESYRFFDKNERRFLDEMAAPNTWGFVPLLEIYNEWDSSLRGGQSDLETSIPFMRAFHQVLTQGLNAHEYHSTPKVVMELIDVLPFIRNNYPEAIDPDTGEIKSQSEINYKGREIMLMQVGEKVEFLEAKSVLGDTKLLAEFLIDCICITSQTPEWAFMRVDSGSANSDRNAQTVPFVKKIERKRRDFTKPVQMLLKMMLAANDQIPVRASISWEGIRADDEVVRMQAFQQLVMGLEVARGRGEISDETYQNMVRMFLPVMGSNSKEKSTPDPVLPAGGPNQDVGIRSGA